MRLIYFLLIGCFLNAQNLHTFVNPFIGTGGHGHTYPGATAPFGMVQLSPDTRIDGSWDGCGGYHYSDEKIYGFSHTHLSGTGVSDYGDFMFMPSFGLSEYEPENYASTFSHANEKAEAGYYLVYLDNYKTKVELSASTYVGFHQYTFDETGELKLILDLNHRDELLEGEIKIIDNQHYLVKRRSKAWAPDQYMFAYVEFEKPMEFEIIKNNGSFENNTANATELLAVFKKNIKSGEVLKFKVSLSFTGYEGAQKNSTTFSGWDFNEMKRNTQAAWDEELKKIEIETDDQDDKTIFYTALYHTMIQPNIAQDIDGRYRGRDNQLHFTDGFDYYTVYSLWDTFRAAHPLYTLIDQKRTVDFINTFLKEYKQGGRLPVWEFASNETDCMIGYHSVSVMADAMSKGIKGFDYELALEAAKHSAELNWLGLESYKKNHFISVDDEHESVSKTLEYAYDDWCIAQMANILGKKEDYNHYMLRSQSWKNVFDPEVGFMQARQNGGWYSPFEPREVNNHYTEGNSWQYSFFVPQDIQGMIKAYGGKEAFTDKLDELFTTSNQTTGRTQVDITGLIGQYAHGNEPSHHIAYLYNFAGQPEKTREKVQFIIKNFYKNAPNGIIGNEDCGQMSAWYVLSSLGLYQVTPGLGNYWNYTEAYFEKAKIHLENGDTIALNNAYFQKLTKTDNPYFSFEELPQNEIKHTPYPNLIIAPIISADSKSFKNELKINIHSNETLKKRIYYSINDSPFKKYENGFTIHANSDIRAYTKTAMNASDTISAHYYKKPNDYQIELFSAYNPQYNAGGPEGLIDGIYGSENWRKGDWQGYQDTDFEAVIDLKKKTKISELSSNYLQDTPSWILMPSYVEYFVSTDGKNFKKVGEVPNTVEANDNEVQTENFDLKFKSQKARFVKVIAHNFGTLPDWHAGYGYEAFIFIDEITIK